MISIIIFFSELSRPIKYTLRQIERVDIANVTNNLHQVGGSKITPMRGNIKDMIETPAITIKTLRTNISIGNCKSECIRIKRTKSRIRYIIIKTRYVLSTGIPNLYNSQVIGKTRQPTEVIIMV